MEEKRVCDEKSLEMLELNKGKSFFLIIKTYFTSFYFYWISQF